jgi:hypothetical protein
MFSLRSPAVNRPVRLAGVALLATCLLAATLGAGAASARPSLKKAIWGPVTLDGKSQFPIYRDLGVGIYETQLRWDDIAPTRPANPLDPADPAYQWPASLDQAVTEAAQSGIRVSVQLMRTPGWANGGRAWNRVPTRPGDFADFAEAAARRYPPVKLWMVWGEPNRSPNFQPLVPETRGRTKLTPAQASAPRYYARMLDATYAALKRVSPSNLVIGGNTFTVGEISPYNWIRYVKLPGGRRPRMDMWGQNPFSARKPDLSKPPHGRGPDVNYSDFSDLDTFAFVLDRHQRDPRGRPLRLFLSEYFLPTDHRNWEFPFYVTRATQASWLTAAYRIARRWSRIYTLGWIGLYDDPPRRDGREVNRGLIDLAGRHKPSYNAYKRA